MANDQVNSITQSVSQHYTNAVISGEQLCCPTGYNHEDLGKFIPEAVLKISYGCGTPVGLSTVQPGEVVLDIGSGGGIDCFEASRRVGEAGKVIGIDMTDEMLALARTHAPTVAENLGYPTSNVDFRKGFADAMPVENGQIDLIISNCVINLAPDKKKVFQEMYRVLRPGGRFTISDIVADQPIPNYLLYDNVKWGDCLSGSLTIQDYWSGLRDAGFLGLHQMTVTPWRVIDGIHFISVTLTGYKVVEASSSFSPVFATFTGPFSQATNELGTIFHRGVPQQIDEQTVNVLALPSYKDFFVLADRPIALTNKDPQWIAVHPEDASCVWKGHFAVLMGPFLSVSDDDDHTYLSGEPLEICSKTLKVLEHSKYQSSFGVINRARESVTAEPVIGMASTGCC